MNQEAMLMEWEQEVTIGRRKIGAGQRAFVIAEIGSNHNQDLSRALELIDAAAEAGADAVKFQSLQLEDVHHRDSLKSETRELFNEIKLDEDWYHTLYDHSQLRDVEFISSPTYYRAIDLLASLPASALKIASAQFAIHPWLVKEAATTGLPLIASAGLASFSEVAAQMEAIESTGNSQIALLHCVSRYPTRVDAVNLEAMTHYREAFGCIVGFSDHTMSTSVAATAVAMGAAVIEKHVTLDRTLPGPDHHFAMEPDEFGEMVTRIREAEAAIGSRSERRFSAEEERYREQFAYKCVTGSSIRKGERVTDIEREARRAEEGIDVRLAELLQRQFVASHDIPSGALLTWSDIRHEG